MITVECPECGADVTIETTTLIGEILVCQDCGVELEVMSLDPVVVDIAPEIEEDWGE